MKLTWPCKTRGRWYFLFDEHCSKMHMQWKLVRKVDWLNDWIEFYAVSAIFQPSEFCTVIKKSNNYTPPPPHPRFPYKSFALGTLGTFSVLRPFIWTLCQHLDDLLAIRWFWHSCMLLSSVLHVMFEFYSTVVLLHSDYFDHMVRIVRNPRSVARLLLHCRKPCQIKK